MATEDLTVISPDEAHERLVSPAPVLITQHEVVLGTAIALRTWPPARLRWAEVTHAMVAAVHRTLAPVTRRERTAPRKHPKRYTFLENACMAREMDRL